MVDGLVRVGMGESRLDFEPQEIFVAPPWEPCRFVAPGGCVLFSYSDRAAQEALGFLREQAEA